jgi:hypothetical protein
MRDKIFFKRAKGKRKKKVFFLLVAAAVDGFGFVA